MKKEKNLVLVGFVLLLGFVAISVVTFWRSSSLIKEGYLAAEGSAAENFALLTASNLRMSDEQVQRVKNYTYAELMASPENDALRSMMQNENFTSKVDYAYVMIHLPQEEVRYQVEEKNQSLYDAPVGTPLDIMWLLDVNVSESAAEAAAHYYDSPEDELIRYSCYIPIDETIFRDAPMYLFNASAWGDHICGYAPLYSTEGSYIGVVAIELQTGDYDRYRSTAVGAMGLLLGVSTLTLVVMAAGLYISNRKRQLEKIYTDPLTRISNRSYYNDCFIKYLNTRRIGGGHFALMIADVDWFKKVNDTFGHEVGDEVLIEVASLLMERFGKAQTIRFGGEEFVVGIWFKEEAELRQKLDELYEALRTRRFTGQAIEVSLSLGCSWCVTREIHGWLLSGMLRSADCLLYEIKENGRRQYRIIPYEDGRVYHKGQPAKPEQGGDPL